jgi:hypothetical protein
MSGTRTASQLYVEATGNAPSTAEAAQLYAEVVGQVAGPTNSVAVAQLYVEVIGAVVGGGNLAQVPQLYIEAVGQIGGSYFQEQQWAGERNFPLGYENRPPKAGRPWRFPT